MGLLRARKCPLHILVWAKEGRLKQGHHQQKNHSLRNGLCLLLCIGVDCWQMTQQLREAGNDDIGTVKFTWFGKTKVASNGK